MIVPFLSTPPAQRRMVGADVVQDWQGGQDIVEEAKLNVTFLFGRWKVIDVLPLDVDVRVDVADFMPVCDCLAWQVVDPGIKYFVQQFCRGSQSVHVRREGDDQGWRWSIQTVPEISLGVASIQIELTGQHRNEALKQFEV